MQNDGEPKRAYAGGAALTYILNSITEEEWRTAFLIRSHLNGSERAKMRCAARRSLIRSDLQKRSRPLRKDA